MKNLNKTKEKAAMPQLKPVKSESRKLLLSLFAVLCVLTCSLSRANGTNFSHYKGNPYTLRSLGLGAIADFAVTHHALLTGNDSGYDFLNAYELPYAMGFSAPNSTYFQNSQCTSCSPFTNNYGDSFHSGSDKWIHIKLIDAGYLTLRGGTSDFDSFFYLLDSNQNVLSHADDGYGSSWSTYGPLQPQIQVYLSAGDYYLIVDGTDKYSYAKKGTVNVDFVLTH